MKEEEAKKKICPIGKKQMFGEDILATNCYGSMCMWWLWEPDPEYRKIEEYKSGRCGHLPEVKRMVYDPVRDEFTCVPEKVIVEYRGKDSTTSDSPTKENS